MALYARASHILVKTEDEAQKLREEIVAGKEFAHAAAESSLCPSGAKGGDLGYFSKGQMVKEFEEAVFSMDIGEMSHPVKTNFGYHLIHLADKKD